MTVMNDTVVVGDGVAGVAMTVALRRAGRTDVPMVHRDRAGYTFDADTDRWRVHTASGDTYQPRVLVLAPGGSDAGRAFLGVAIHGRPNLFFVESDRQARYVVECLTLLDRTGCTRIEVRAGTQHEFHRRIAAVRSRSAVLERRALRAPKPGHFDLTVAADREPAEEYRGPAVLCVGHDDIAVIVTLGGHRDPIDGRYHWYGRLVAADATATPEPGRGEVTLTVPGGAATAARLEERDPWGNLRVTGAGEPPFPL